MVFRIPSNFRVYSFSTAHKPVLRVKPDSLILFEVRDAFDGQLDLSGDYLPNIDAVDRGRINPATGPVWIEEAMPGYTIEVEVLSVKVESRGFIGRRVFRILDDTIEADSFRIPIKPVIGVIGVAPLKGEASTMEQGDFGGNLDTPEITVGSRVFLPVWVEGGLLALGDVHAVQGDGEVSGQGLEVPAEVEARVKLHRGCILDKVIVDYGGSLTILASSKTLEDAIDEVLNAAKKLFQKAFEIDEQTALALLSLTSNLGISQIVNLKKTVKIKIPKNVVPINLEKLLSD
ncbi:acetamidase/formamidase family protein [Candidatus Bathyarchaeota archaeon]|nr:acetamidase/formamidase family protein [Candidatus Bathyarchaeota archaeon]